MNTNTGPFTQTELRFCASKLWINTRQGINHQLIQILLIKFENFSQWVPSPSETTNQPKKVSQKILHSLTDTMFFVMVPLY